MKVQRISKSYMAVALVFILTSTAPVFATLEQAPHEEGAKRIHQEETRRPPSLFFVQWAGLLLILGVGGQYVFRRLKKKGVNKESRARAYILTMAAMVVLALNYHPAVKDFDEPPIFGFIKFLVALVSAAMLTFYGVLGRHDEHQGEKNARGDQK